MYIVTGASRGIGRTICERLVANGDEVLGLARSVETSSFRALNCDVSSYEDVKRVAQLIKREGTRVKGLINAAGIASMNLAITTPAQVAQRIVNTNLLGTIHCCQFFTPLMMRNKTGVVINFSTIAVTLALKGESIYVASKAGVEAFTRAFAREVSDFHIRVNCLAPGPIHTDMLRGLTEEQIQDVVKQQILPMQFATEAIADLVEILMDDRSSSLSGQILHVGGA